MSNGGMRNMLSENIKQLRKQKGYTQETLAQALNIVRQTVSKWEKGYSVPDADMLEKLADILEVPVSDLLGEPAEPQVKTSDIEKISSQLAILNNQMAMAVARRRRNLRIVLIVIAAVLALMIAGTIFLFHSFRVEAGIGSGKVDNVEVRHVDSSLFSQEDINEAIDKIEMDFMKDWNGCELTKIYYAGDEISKAESEIKGVKTMVLLSEFKTYKQPGDSSLNENDTYKDWKWILIKTKDGCWEHVDHGYA